MYNAHVTHSMKWGRNLAENEHRIKKKTHLNLTRSFWVEIDGTRRTR